MNPSEAAGNWDYLAYASEPNPNSYKIVDGSMDKYYLYEVSNNTS